MTYTVVSSVEEVEELLSTILGGGGARADPGLTLLQPLLREDTVMRLCTLLSHRIQRILGEKMKSSGVEMYIELSLTYTLQCIWG